jgi:ketosteroid isomerase-like protein
MRPAALPALLLAAAVAGGCATTGKDEMVVTDRVASEQASSTAVADQGLNAEIERFLARYAELYNRQDYPALLAMWDRESPNPIYMAEEIDPPMHGWNVINAYFNPPPQFPVLESIRNEYTKVKAHAVAPDVAVATYRLRFDIKLRGKPAVSSYDRVMAVFKKRDGEWKLTAYTEAPMAPLTMVRQMTQKSDLPEAERQALLGQVRTMLQKQVPADFEQWQRDQAAQAKAAGATGKTP